MGGVCQNCSITTIAHINGPANQYLPHASVRWCAITLLSSSTPPLPQDGDRISKQFLCNIWKKRNELPNVGGVSIRTRHGALSRKDAWSMVK